MSYIPQHYSFRIKTKHLSEYLLLRTTYFLVNLLPYYIIRMITSITSRLVWLFIPFRITVAYDNLSVVFPNKTHREKLSLIKSAYHRMIHAAGLIFVIHRRNISKLITDAEIGNIDVLDQALSEGKGVVLTTYHGCWFEAYFAWFSKEKRPTSLIYKRQKNPHSDGFFVRLRNRYGSSLRHIDKYEKLKEYEKELSENRILIISLDQNYIDNGVPVSFFNQEFICARGAGLLHLKTGAPVLTSVYYIKNGQLHIDFERVELPEYAEINDKNISEISNLAIKIYEKTVMAFPDQWFSLFHRLWKKKGYPPRISRSFKDIFTA